MSLQVFFCLLQDFPVAGHLPSLGPWQSRQFTFVVFPVLLAQVQLTCFAPELARAPMALPAAFEPAAARAPGLVAQAEPH